MATKNGKSGTFTIKTENPYISGYVAWQETYDDTTYSQTNKTRVTINVYLHRTNYYTKPTWFESATVTRNAYFGKENVKNTSVIGLSIAGSNNANGTATSGGGAFTEIYTASKEITHDANGTKSITLGFSMTNSETGVTGRSFTVPETYNTVTLTTIPRYANITKFEVNPIDETSVSFVWSADVNCDYAWFSTDNGSNWSDLPNTNVISGLEAGKTYNFKLKVRRTDNQLTSVSSTYSKSTYNYPHCTSSPNFTIGDTLTLDFYNPLGRAISVYGYSKSDSREIFTGTTNGTKLVGFNDESSVDKQYASIPTSKSGEYKVVVVYGDIQMTRDAGNTYQIRGDEKPTINDFDYYDGNDTVVAITGDNTHIVQNYSNLVARFTSATPSKGAGAVALYIIECNGKSLSRLTGGSYSLGTVDSERDVELTLSVIDSRGLGASKTINVTVISHSQPTATVELQRLNNYEDETYLTVDGSISRINGKNTMTIKYRYREEGGNYGSYTVIENREKNTLFLDKNKGFIFEITVTDAFGSQFVDEYVIGKGVFPLFIDIEKNSVGVNKFPKHSKSIEALGLISLGEREAIELEVGESVEIPIYLYYYSALVNFIIAGVNLEVARLLYVFRSNQYFGTHKLLLDESFQNTSSVVPMIMWNEERGYVLKVTNNHTSTVYVRYGVFELC